jgi:hypothetical protein
MPVHVVGAEFRPGAGLVVRFGGVPAAGSGASTTSSAFSQSNAATAASAAAAAASAAETAYSSVAVVPAVWVSSAVLKVEPPAAAHASGYRDVPLEVSVNGGVSYSTEVLQYREEIPV